MAKFKMRIVFFLCLIFAMSITAFAEMDQGITFQGIPWTYSADDYMREVKSIMRYRDANPNYDKEFSVSNMILDDPNTFDISVEKRCGFKFSLYEDILFHSYPVKWVVGYSAYNVIDGQIDTDPSNSHVIQIELSLDTEQIDNLDVAFDDLVDHFTEKYGDCAQLLDERNTDKPKRDVSWIKDNAFVIVEYEVRSSATFSVVYGIVDATIYLDSVREILPEKRTNEDLWGDKEDNNNVRYFEDCAVEIVSCTTTMVDGVNYIVFYYDWLNNTGEQTSFFFKMHETVQQDGIDLDRAYFVKGVDSNYDQEIMPEESLNVKTVYKLKNDKSTVKVAVEPWDNILYDGYSPLSFTINLMPNLD